MASKFRVDDLRSQLSLRGLDDTGIKPILVKRLEAAIHKEEKEKENGKKRPREQKEALEDAAPDEKSKKPRDSLEEKPKERVSIEQLQKMGVRQLRELASRHRLPDSGSKKELIERLSVDRDKDSEENLEEDASRTATANGSDKKPKGSLDERPKEEEFLSTEKLKKMAVHQLRELASRRHLPDIGSKKELIERLLADKGEPEEKEDASGTATANGSHEKPKGSLDERPEEDEFLLTEELKKMGVHQLRELASRRHLPENGSKKELIERLLADKGEPEEKEDASRTATASGSDKKPKGSLDERPEEEEFLSTEKLKKMGVHQLRELASRRHLAENGSKKELTERLLADTGEPEEKVGGELKEQKLITATKKGGAVLDQWLPDDIKSSFHVLQLGEEIYDAILNQTNVGANNNKFYVIQALESDDGGKFLVYNRWGRVGVRGQDKLHGPYTSQEKALAEFQMKFFDKTKNHWSNRKDFICHPKCYTWLEMDYDVAEEGTVPKKDVSNGAQLRETKLEPRIAKFISLICNISMMKQQMLEIGYNAEKLPLGKLSKSTILKGYDVLKRIADVISQPDRKTLEQLSGEFYTVIPHDFGFRKMREFIIDTPFKLKCKLEMVAALAEIEIATKILKEDAELGDDPLYSRYRLLHCELAPVEANSDEFSMIEKYMRNTHATTHSSYTVDIEQIFKVSREGESEHFSKFANVKNRMLLWHGSRLTNWTGILSQGLRIAPPEAPVTGYMFGKGVYFADMFSKSANYCFATKECSTGVLLLCEVALGDMSELLSADYKADRLPEGKLSTKGVGATAPDMSEAQAFEDDLVVPLGKPKEQTGNKGSLLYNEYIVYNVQQIRMRYVVQVNFKWNWG